MESIIIVTDVADVDSIPYGVSVRYTIYVADIPWGGVLFLRTTLLCRLSKIFPICSSWTEIPASSNSVLNEATISSLLSS